MLAVLYPWKNFFYVGSYALVIILTPQLLFSPPTHPQTLTVYVSIYLFGFF